MSEIIIKKTEYFSWLPNRLVNDPTISAECIACALYLNSKPDSWVARPHDIRKRFGWGRGKWLKVSKELKSGGLLVERRGGAINGKKGATTLIFQLPPLQNIDSPKNRPSKKSMVEKSNPLEKKDELIQKKDYLKNKEVLCASSDAPNSNDDKKIALRVPTKRKSASSEVLAAFERLWAYYPLKKGKHKAYKAFCSFLDANPQESLEVLTERVWRGLEGLLQERRWLREAKEHEAGDIFVPELPHGSTWFSQSRWDDDYETDPVAFLAKVRLTQKRR